MGTQLGLTHQVLEADIESLSHDGRGVARIDGKVYFIEDALPGELVRFSRGRRRRSYETGKTVELLRRSRDRVEPPCEYFGVCGGCSLQHLAEHAQIGWKQRQLAENLQKIAKTKPVVWLDALAGPVWNYRRKARLGIRFVPKKGGALVGFRERNKSYITSLQRCRVLDHRISDLLPDLHSLVGGLSCRDRIPQIEVAVGQEALSLVFRHLKDFSDADLDELRHFAVDHDAQVYLQPQGLDSIHPLSPTLPEMLSYTLPAYGLRIRFGPTDFVQVNDGINNMLVDLAVSCLDPEPHERVLDLFCGVGNFTLPIARAAESVIGVEGDRGLVDRARGNARENGLDNVEFTVADLYLENPDGDWLRRNYDKVLLDPPRTGAIDLVKHLDRLAPRRVVYISCNPATLARDAEVMVHKLDFTLSKAGVINMFPHTNHVESIAVFDRPALAGGPASTAPGGQDAF